MTNYDAGLEREWLAERLASWQARGFIESAVADQFNRRVRRLARVVGWSRDRVLAQAQSDAEQIRFNEIVEN
jgi:hypothetical protein